MLKDVPCGGGQWLSEAQRNKRLDTNLAGFYGFVRVDVTVEKEHLWYGRYPMLPERVEGGLLQWNCHDKKRAVCFSEELRAVMQRSGCVVTKVHQALRFNPFPALRRYIQVFQHLKQDEDAKGAAKNNCLRNAYKLLMNGLYGKLLQRVCATETRLCSCGQALAVLRDDKKPLHCAPRIINENCYVLTLEKGWAPARLLSSPGSAILGNSKVMWYDLLHAGLEMGAVPIEHRLTDGGYARRALAARRLRGVGAGAQRLREAGAGCAEAARGGRWLRGGCARRAPAARRGCAEGRRRGCARRLLAAQRLRGAGAGCAEGRRRGAAQRLRQAGAGCAEAARGGRWLCEGAAQRGGAEVARGGRWLRRGCAGQALAAQRRRGAAQRLREAGAGCAKGPCRGAAQRLRRAGAGCAEAQRGGAGAARGGRWLRRGCAGRALAAQRRRGAAQRLREAGAGCAEAARGGRWLRRGAEGWRRGCARRALAAQRLRREAGAGCAEGPARCGR